MFAIKHNPSNKYTNLTSKGIDAINLGINPKVYTKREDAEKELSTIDSAIEHNRKANANGRKEFEHHLSELEKKQAIKIHPTRTKNIQFYKMRLETITRQEEQVNQLRATDFEIVAI